MVWKCVYFWAFFLFRPVHREPQWETDKNMFFDNTSNNVYLPKKISYTHLEYLKKRFKKKEMPKSWELKYLVSFEIIFNICFKKFTKIKFKNYKMF